MQSADQRIQIFFQTLCRYQYIGNWNIYLDSTNSGESFIAELENMRMIYLREEDKERGK
jgi:hypothetical protein